MQYTAPIIICQEGEVLHDISATGRETPWAAHKAQSQIVAAAMYDDYPQHAARMVNCAERLTFIRDWQDQAQPGRLRLAKAYFCRNRLCPICQWRRSLKMGAQARAALEYIARHNPKRYVMLTLTVRNCAPDQLGRTLDLLQGGWQRLMQRRQVRSAVQGYIKSTEITYNRKTGTMHPHIHALLAVNRSYFTSRYYIKQADWAALWAKAARLDYNPSVDIRRATGDAASIAEVTKYSTKPGDYINPQDVGEMQSVLGALMECCTKRRFCAWGGCLKDAHAALGLDDCEDGDLVHTGLDLDGLSDAGAALWDYDWYCGPKLYIKG